MDAFRPGSTRHLTLPSIPEGATFEPQPRDPSDSAELRACADRIEHLEEQLREHQAARPWRNPSPSGVAALIAIGTRDGATFPAVMGGAWGWWFVGVLLGRGALLQRASALGATLLGAALGKQLGRRWPKQSMAAAVTAAGWLVFGALGGAAKGQHLRAQLEVEQERHAALRRG